MNVRRVIDPVVLVLVAFTGAQSLREAPGIFATDGLVTWRGLVGLGQVLMGVGAATTLVAYWRRPSWLRAGTAMWGIGSIVAGTIATFAWSTFNRVAFSSAFLASCLLAVGVGRWGVLRNRANAEKALADMSTA